MKKYVKKFLRKTKDFWNLPKLNIFSTLYFNLRTMPFSVAIKFPVYIYGRVKFCALYGHVEFRNTSLKSGMIKFGKHSDMFYGCCEKSIISIGTKGKIIFEGPCLIGTGFYFNIFENAVLQMGKYVVFGKSLKIICLKEISIGNYTRIGFDSQIMDSNIHYIVDVAKKTVFRKCGTIQLGKFNWIGNRVSILKGTKTPNYTTAAACSVLNKDYTATCSQNIMLAGVPAKVVVQNVQRVFSFDIEKKIDHYFNTNPESNVLEWDECWEDNLESLISSFN